MRFFCFWMLAVAVSCIAGVGSEGLCASEEVQQIQQAIDQAGARWTAGENAVVQMPPEERQHLLGGVLPEAAPFSDTGSTTPPKKNDPVPAEFDWRDYQGFNWMTSVKNQLSCGSCAAFASVGSLEAAVKIAEGKPGWDIDLSEQHLFSCAGGDCPTGLYMGDAFDYIQNSGVPDETCLPYSAVDDNCDQSCEDWQDLAVKVDSWDLLWQYQVDDEMLKTYVLEHPVACYMEVYNDFYSYSSGIYEYVSGALKGGHFVVVVGWNDAEDTWICKNSWGAGWGENGYFRIKRGETSIASWAMFGHYSAAGAPTPSPTAVPTGTPTAEPTVTPTLALGVALDMPAKQFDPGDSFYVNAVITNPGETLEQIPLFVILDAGGYYWFWPRWKTLPEIDWRSLNVPTGISSQVIIEPFEWPEVDGSGAGLSFWAALLDPDMQEILGIYDRQEWGY